MPCRHLKPNILIMFCRTIVSSHAACSFSYIPDPMLTYQQWCFVAPTWEQFHNKCSWTPLHVFRDYTLKMINISPRDSLTYLHVYMNQSIREYLGKPTNISRELFPRALHWSHNGHEGVSNHQPHDCLLKRLFRRRSKKASKLRVTGLREGNSPVTGEFPTQRASNAENVSIWWRHHGHKILAIYGKSHKYALGSHLFCFYGNILVD